MGAARKTVLRTFGYMRCDDFASYLSAMAAKGWHFKEWGVGLTFEKGEPEQAVYAVEVFRKASENDMRPGPDAQEFAEYCEAAGWKFLDAKQKYCIFKRIKEDAVELFTPEERVTNAFRSRVSGAYLLLLFLYGFNAFLQWSHAFRFLENVIFTVGFLFNVSIWTVMFVGQLLLILQAFGQRSRLRKAIRRGDEVYIGNRKNGKWRLGWNDVYIGILILLLMYYFVAIDRVGLVIINAIIVIGTIGFAVLLNKLRPDRDVSLLLQIGFVVVLIVTLLMSVFVTVSDDGTTGVTKVEQLPLKISDYRMTADEVQEMNIYREENILGSVEEYFVYGDRESIRYSVYQSPSSWLLGLVWDDLISGKKYNEGAVDCAISWDAKEAIRNQLGTYYVRYENTLLELNDGEDVDLTEEQIEIIRNNLKLR